MSDVLTEELRSAFRDWLKDLADDILEKDLQDLKQLMKGKKGYGIAVLDGIKTVWEFFDRLESNSDLSPFDTDYLKTLLERIHRVDLCKKVDIFKENHMSLTNAGHKAAGAAAGT